jgi:hypothetical protein
MTDEFLSAPRPVYTRQNTGNGGQTRILRDRQRAYTRAMDRAQGSNRAFTSARQLVQVFNGGSMPAAVPRVYFTHPVLATGTVSEGGIATLTTDTMTTVPVIFLNHVPAVGDYATAYSVGGRWVAEESTPGGSLSVVCSPCSLPKSNLTISWTNPLTGNGSATLVYTASPQQWLAQCVDSGLTFKLLCTSGGIELQITYYTSGGCPGGTSQFCSNLRASPLELLLTASTCSPLSLTFSPSSPGHFGDLCPQVYSLGNTQLTVTL